MTIDIPKEFDTTSPKSTLSKTDGSSAFRTASGKALDAKNKEQESLREGKNDTTLAADSGNANQPMAVKFDRLGRIANLPAGETSMGRMLEVHKALWLPAGICSMLVTNNYSPRATLMTGLFGAYGIVWVIKSNVYPDLNFYNGQQARIKANGLVPMWVDYLTKFAFVGVYFLYPVLSVTNTAELHPIVICLSSLFFCIGGFFHWAGDAQRYFQLKFKPGCLITDGFYAHVRHPSYLGEILMWISLTLLAGPMNILSWFPVLWLVMITILVGVPTKEKSLSRYGDEFLQWKENVPMLLPRLFVAN